MAAATTALLMGLFVVGASAADCTHTGTALTEVSQLTTEGTYYLSADLTATANVTVSGNVTLCLNDKTLTSSATATGTNFITVASGGKLTICGGKEGAGTIAYHSERTAILCGIEVQSGGELVLNSGKISGFSSSWGGGVVNRATFTMNGGEITGCKASGNGGGVYNTSGATFTMNEGKITNNAANGGGETGYGGGVHNLGTFNMAGGTITGNDCKNYSGYELRNEGTFSMTGGTIESSKDQFLYTKNQTTISGNSTLSGGQIQMFNAIVTFSEHNGSAPKVTLTSADHSLRSLSFDYPSTVTISAGTFEFTKAALTTGSGVTLTITGGRFSSDPSSYVTDTATYKVLSISDGDLKYAVAQPLALAESGATTLTKDSYLAADVPADDQIIVSGAVVLDLNGNTLTAPNLDLTDFMVVKSGGKLTVCDSSTTGTIKGGGNTATRGINVNSGGTLVLDSGTISGFTTAEYGAGVINSGTFTMNGGTITENKVTGTAWGGGVYAAYGTFTMNGGTISSNTAAANGGGVAVRGETGTFTMNGGRIEKNAAGASRGYGGGVHNVGTFTLKSGTITGNTAYRGGGVNNTGSGTFAMEGGTVETTTAGDTGGAVFVNSGSTAENPFVMTNGTLKGTNTSWNFLMTSAPGTKISDNAKLEGASVYLDTATISGGTFTLSSNLGAREGDGVTITGGSFNIAGFNDVKKFYISGGKFSQKPAVSYLATDAGMLSVRKNTDTDAAAYPYVVGKGYYRTGEFMDFGSSLALTISLTADKNFEYAEGTTLTVNGTPASFTSTTDPLTFTISGIVARAMDDEYAVLVKDSAGSTLYSETLSVYALAKEWYDASKATTLLEDMINYGRAAQKEFDGSPAMNALGNGTTTDPNWTTDSATNGVTSGDASKVAATLSLKDQIELNIYVDAPAEQVTVNAGTEENASTTDGGSITRIKFGDIAVKNAKNDIDLTITITNDDTTTEIITLKYSIEDYVVNALTKGSQSELLTALQKYVDSVINYLTSATSEA